MGGIKLEVRFDDNPAHLALVTAEADGTFKATVVIPRSAKLGKHQLVVTGVGGPSLSVSLPIALVATTSPASSGGDLRLVALLAVVCVATAVLAHRLRRRLSPSIAPRDDH